DLLCELGENGIPFSIIFTKSDKQSATAVRAQVERDRAQLSEFWEELPPMFLSSAATGEGKEAILTYIDQILASLQP
ncbi:MAG: hypothetical protein J6T07_07330, partial [Bacteroidales bacterium]|nr:hypothetical protein [Bacteroidales bacterium]